MQIAQYVYVGVVYTCTYKARGEYCNVCSKLEHTVSEGRSGWRGSRLGVELNLCCLEEGESWKSSEAADSVVG